MSLEQSFLGAMIGSAVGDAIGELGFRYRRRERLLTAISGHNPLVYTDDTAMALALAESLVAIGDVHSQRLGDTFRAHFEREPWRGYGPGPPAVFARVAQARLSYEAAARALYGGEGSLGNGAAMRIAPLALLFFDAGTLYEKVEQSARVTHAHAVGVDGAAVQARAIADAVRCAPTRALDGHRFLQGLIEFCRTTEIRSKLAQLSTMLAQNASAQAVAEQLKLSVAVQESMPFSLYCFLRHPQSYENCLCCAVTHGGDRDTMGAMAGAVSGAYLGIDAIPSLWRQNLENREAIERLALSLLAKRPRE